MDKTGVKKVVDKLTNQENLEKLTNPPPTLQTFDVWNFPKEILQKLGITQKTVNKAINKNLKENLEFLQNLSNPPEINLNYFHLFSLFT